MSADHNRWIITAHKFREYRNIEVAIAEMARIKSLDPRREYRMVRIKRTAHDRDCAVYLGEREDGQPKRCTCPLGEDNELAKENV